MPTDFVTAALMAVWRDHGKVSESRFSEEATRPTACPFCQGKGVDTIAKTITVRTLWRCRQCEKTWTIASRAASPVRSLVTRR